MSCIFFFAISVIWLRLMVPADLVPVVWLPFSIFAAFKRKCVLGGLFISKLKVRSA